LNLYQIDSAIAECVDAESGEVLDFDKLTELSMERDRKIENIALWIKNDLSEAKAIREEENSLAARRQSLERAAESKKRYLESVLNGEKFSTAKCSVRFRNTASVEIDDMAAAVAWMVANDHVDEVSCPAPTVSKTDLARLMKSGAQIDGARLVQGRSMGVK
jgi:hypothetical protein